jgi:hypothetical protein
MYTPVLSSPFYECVCRSNGIYFRLLIIVILVHLRGHSCIMVVCMSQHGTFVSIPMCSQNKWRSDYTCYLFTLIYPSLGNISPLHMLSLQICYLLLIPLSLTIRKIRCKLLELIFLGYLTGGYSIWRYRWGTTSGVSRSLSSSNFIFQSH